MGDSQIDANKPFAEEGYALMGAAFEVHKELGGGKLEEIYQQSLEIELRLRNIPSSQKKNFLSSTRVIKSKNVISPTS